MRKIISIITLTYNKINYIQTLYQGLINNTRYPYWEWVVADTGDDTTSEYLRSRHDSRISIYKFKPGNFSTINNNLVRYCKGEYVVFINNDIYPEPFWLESLIGLLDLPGIGAVGAKLVYPNKTIQHVGIDFNLDSDESIFHIFRNKIEKEVILPAKVISVPAITAACFAIRKKLFIKIGGFDRKYKGGYYEDVDLCMKIRLAGYSIVLNSDSRLQHISAGSLDVSNRFWRHIPQNKIIFQERWNEFISSFPKNRIIPYYLNKNITIAFLNKWLEVLGGGEYEFLLTIKYFERFSKLVHVFYKKGKGVNIKEHIFKRFGLTFAKNVVFNPDHKLDKYAIVWDHTYLSDSGKFREKTNIYVKRIMLDLNKSNYKKNDKLYFVSKFIRDKSRYKNNKFSEIIYPPVEAICKDRDIENVIKKKENIILNVGRFCGYKSYLNWKNQLSIIKYFKTWEYNDKFILVLIGGIDSYEYLKKCKEEAKRYSNVLILANINKKSLNSYYKRSKYYLHFCGYQGKTLANCEHFGISIVEALSAGCITMCFNGGGIKEIIKDGENGWLWNDLSELTNILNKLERNTSLKSKHILTRNAFVSSKKYSVGSYYYRLEQLTDDICRVNRYV